MAKEWVRTYENGVLVAEREVDIPDPTREDYGAAVEAHVDAVARAKGYSGAVSMISYQSSGVPQFAAEAALMRNWRDSVWATVGVIEAEVTAGRRPAPSIGELIAALPPISWPEQERLKER